MIVGFRREIGVATSDDAEAISAVLAASYGVLFRGWYDGQLLDDILPIITRADPVLLASGQYYTGIIDGGIVACGGWSPAAPGTKKARPGIGHVRHFATHPDHVGQGFGRAIMNQSIAQALATGIDQFECLSSLPAEAFYAALGFVAVEKAAVPLGPTLRMPAVAMRLPLVA